MGVRPVGSPRRREHLDWLRGVAVLLMIDAHLIDSWTRFPDRDTGGFDIAMIVGGAGTTLFLFLSGVSVGLSAGSKLRRTGNVDAAARAVALRGLEIFALAFLFRLQAFFLGWSPRWLDLLKVDILNVMGPSIAAAALLWRFGSSTRSRAIIFATATAATAFLTPIIQTLPRGWLPQPLYAYIVPVQGLSNFVFFPWIALVFAGGCAGVLIDAGQTSEADARTHRRLAWGGAVVSVAAFVASSFPTALPASDFWTTSPAYLFMRSGLMTLAIVGSHVLGEVVGRWRALEPAGAARAHVALHLLDSRRARLRTDLQTVASRADAVPGVHRLRDLLRADAGLLDSQGADRAPLRCGRRLPRRSRALSAAPVPTRSRLSAE